MIKLNRNIDSQIIYSGFFAILPNETLFHIVKWLDIYPLSNLSLTCKRFAEIGRDEPTWSIFSKTIEIASQSKRQEKQAHKTYTLESLKKIYPKIERFLYEDVSSNFERLKPIWKSDLSFFIKFIPFDPKIYESASPEIRRDWDLALHLVLYNRSRIVKNIQLDPHLAADINFMTLAVNCRGEWLALAHSDLKKNRQLTLDAVSTNGLSLKDAEDNFKRDKEVVIIAVRNKGAAIEFADSSLQQNPNILLQAIWNSSTNLPSARIDKETLQISFQRDEGSYFFLKVKISLISQEIERALIMRNPSDLALNYHSIKIDRPFILELVKKDGYALRFVDSIFQQDEEIVFTSINTCLNALLWTHESLLKNRNFILRVIKEYHFGCALNYTADILKNDPILIEEALKNGLDRVPEGFKVSEELALRLIRESGIFLNDYSTYEENFVQSTPFIKACLAYKGLWLQTCPAHLQDDFDSVCLATNQNPDAFQYASKEIRNNLEAVIKIVSKKPLAFKWVGRSLKDNLYAICAAAEHDGAVLAYVAPKLRKHPRVLEALLKSIESDLTAFENSLYFIGLHVLDNPGFVLKAIDLIKRSKGPVSHQQKLIQRVFYSLRQSIRNNPEFINRALELHPPLSKYIFKNLIPECKNKRKREIESLDGNKR